jgi:hypothetical protein
MTKIDFTKLTVQVSFNGAKRVYNIAGSLGNDMMFNGSVICDIGFEELAKEIYFSKGEVEVPEKYAQYILRVMEQCNYTAALRREVTRLLHEQ